MFWLLNRLRGGALHEHSFFGKISFRLVNAFMLGALTYLIDYNYVAAILVAVLYVFGESHGWGMWVSAMIDDDMAKGVQNVGAPVEAKYTGISYLSNYLIPPHKYGWLNAVFALSIRGALWFVPVLSVLFCYDYIHLVTYIASVGILSVGFPLSFIFANMSFKYGNIKRTPLFINAWGHGEVWYGAMQDLVLLLIILDVCCG